MKTLNLVYLQKSDIKYQIQKFPDGQQNIVINKNDCYENAYGYLLMTHEDCKVTIKSRLNNWLDLELIVCANASLRELGVEEIHLYTPYIIGARSDRKFSELRTIYENGVFKNQVTLQDIRNNLTKI